MEKCTSKLRNAANSTAVTTRLAGSGAPETTRGRALPRRRSRSITRRGQAAVVALLVMLLLAFAGALFVTVVARNLINAGRQNRVETSDYYADAGIHYADQQLTDSVLGADWRPVPPKIAISQNDPDASYLNATPPYVRYNMGNGRFLLRVTYVAHPSDTTPGGATSAAGTTNDPAAGYIEIESIGREGSVQYVDGSYDPTTYTPSKQNTTLVAWKSIGITQYGLFVTNIDKRADVAAIGVPSYYDKDQTNQLNNTGSGPTDGVLTAGIVTPGVVDFTDGGDAATVPYQPYPVITQLGAPDAYLVNGSGTNATLSPNPYAGEDSSSLQYNINGTYTETVNGVPNTVVAPGGGTLRSNADTRFFGLNEIYLNNASYGTYLSNLKAPVTSNLLLNEDIEIAGNLLLDQFNNGTAGTSSAPAALNPPYTQDAALVIDPPPGLLPSTNPVTYPFVLPSTAPGLSQGYAVPTGAVNTDTNFDSKGGVVRDGQSGNDVYGNPREVKPIAPPAIDTVNADTGMTRYRDLAINSPARNSSWTIPNPGQYGFGQTIYVNNTNDTQTESTVAGAGYSLTDEWLNRNAGASSTAKNRWNGGIYTPPGVEITFGDLRPYGFQPSSTSQSAYGIYLLRHDVDNTGTPVTWKDPVNSKPGGIVDSLNPGLMVTYDELNASNPNPSSSGSGSSTNTGLAVNRNNDVVIVCEGNVRLRGSVSADPNDTTVYGTADTLPRHITIITYGTAYIEGNLLRGNPNSSIAVLAHDYVCVNTTQFTAGHVVQNEPTGDVPPSDAADVDAGGLDFGVNQGLSEEFSFGLPYTGTTANTPATAYNNSVLALYYEGRPATPGQTQVDFNLFNPRVNLPGQTPTGPEKLYSPGPDFGVGNGASASGAVNPTLDTFPISSTSIYTELSGTSTTSQALTSLIESEPLHLWITKDPSVAIDPVISRVAILPMDIRIEAVLYAQTRSFFVIPGEWFNDHADDTLDKYANPPPAPNGQTATAPFSTRGAGIADSDVNQARYPFYGQPIDLKITIYGAVSEAHPADIGAQSEWMKKWGWIPQYHGSLTGAGSVQTTAEPSGHPNPYATSSNPMPGIGLSIVYDPQCGFPVGSTLTGATGYTYMRADAYGNPLPFAPCLPVCPGLLYSGQMPSLPSS